MGIKDVLSKLVGYDDVDDEFDIEPTEEEIAEEKEKIKKGENSKSNLQADNHYSGIAPLAPKGRINKYSMNGSAPFKMIVIEPKNLEECKKLVDNLKSRKPVIINLEKVETEQARKMFDFLSGAVYALNGNVQRVTSNIFIFAPANVDIAAKVNKETVEDNVFGSDKSPWE